MEDGAGESEGDAEDMRGLYAALYSATATGLVYTCVVLEKGTRSSNMAEDQRKKETDLAATLAKVAQDQREKEQDLATTLAKMAASSAAKYDASDISKYLSSLSGYPSINVGSVASWLSQPDQAKVRGLETEISRLKGEAGKVAEALRQEKSATQEHKKLLAELQTALADLTKKQQLAFLLPRVRSDAADFLLDSEQLYQEFLKPEPRPLFAMSVDIRRSTELMLKARSPRAFAQFITTLCKDLMDIVRKYEGVVDKFTGDGILCFFPEFFSGEDAGYYALAAADECHRIFAKHYRAQRDSFRSVLKDIGLGIGIDYGECQLVEVAGSLTIVGPAVVYACRLGGAPAGKTLLNQPAYEQISEKHGGLVLLDETSIEIKHEGELVAYAAKLSRRAYSPKEPAWARAPKDREVMTAQKSDPAMKGE
jgi:class 3 adenylate cyclase